MREWYGFTSDSARRIGDVVRKVERTPVRINRRPAKGEVFVTSDTVTVENISGVTIPRFGILRLLLPPNYTDPNPDIIHADRPPYPGIANVGIATEEIAIGAKGAAWVRGVHPGYGPPGGDGAFPGWRFGATGDSFYAGYDDAGPFVWVGRTYISGSWYPIYNIIGTRASSVYVANIGGSHWYTIIWDGFYLGGDLVLQIGHAPFLAAKKWYPPPHVGVWWDTGSGKYIGGVIAGYEFGDDVDVIITSNTYMRQCDPGWAFVLQDDWGVLKISVGNGGGGPTGSASGSGTGTGATASGTGTGTGATASGSGTGTGTGA